MKPPPWKRSTLGFACVTAGASRAKPSASAQASRPTAADPGRDALGHRLGASLVPHGSNRPIRRAVDDRNRGANACPINAGLTRTHKPPRGRRSVRGNQAESGRGRTRVRRIRARERGDPDAEQSHRTGRVVCPQQSDGGRADHRRPVRRRVQRAHPGDRGPVIEPDLDPDRSPGETTLAELGGETLRLVAQDLLEPGPVGDVMIERGLDRARLGGAAGNRRVVAKMGTAMEPVPVTGAEPAHEVIGRVRLEVADRLDPDRAQALGGLRPDPGNQPRRLGGETARLPAHG